MGPEEDSEQRVAYNLSCPSVHLCVTSFLSKIITTTNPTGPASAWHAVDVQPAGLDAEGKIDSLTCPSVSLCVAGMNEWSNEEGGGTSLEFATTTSPAGEASAWNVFPAPTFVDYLTQVACSPGRVCAGGDEGSGVIASINPTGGTTDWSRVTNLASQLEYGTCPSIVAVRRRHRSGTARLLEDPCRVRVASVQASERPLSDDGVVRGHGLLRGDRRRRAPRHGGPDLHSADKRLALLAAYLLGARRPPQRGDLPLVVALHRGRRRRAGGGAPPRRLASASAHGLAAVSLCWPRCLPPLSCAGSRGTSASGPRCTTSRVQVPDGATLAVLGRNGAGKSTLLRILATLLRPHAGEVLVFGEPLPRRAFAVRGRLGLLAHEPLLYRELTGRENLEYHAALHRVDPGRVGEVLAAVQMERRADEPVRLLSRGMVQRLAVCRAVLHDPALLLLDEPRANLDPAAVGAGRAADRPAGRTHPGAHQPRSAGGAGRGRPRARAQGRPRRLRRRARGLRRRPAAGALRMRTALVVLRKDLRLELRTWETVPAMVLFALVTFVIFHFGLNRDTIDGQEAAGVLTATLLFAAMLGVNRLFVAEREQGGFDAFLLAPVDRSAMLVAKAAASSSSCARWR